MKYELKMQRSKISIIIIWMLALCSNAKAEGDSIPSGFSRPLQWRMGTEAGVAWVPGTCSYLDGSNPLGERVNSNFSGGLRADFSFSPDSREGMLYKGLYQGFGVSAGTFSADGMLGTPVSAYVYQGAPIAHLSRRAWMGYEWQFGAAFGWKHSNEKAEDNNTATGTAVTAHMGLGLKLHYMLSNRWQLSVGAMAHHFSNGNTEYPNSGVNTIGASIGIAYTINPMAKTTETPAALEQEADRGRWFYDITAYGAWRRRIITLGEPAEKELCPGKFGVIGVQFSPMRQLNRWVAVGPAVDVQWDESAGLAPYWIDGTFDENMKFERPPFGKRLSAGLSAHAELTMPIFAVNVGLGYDFINPKGNKAFYQSLTLKTFITKNVYINTGYRLGKFEYPQNLMLGAGIRLR